MDILANFDASQFFRALGLALMLEGVLWAGFPRGMLSAMESLRGRPDLARSLGVSGLGVGLLVSALAS